MSTTRSDIWPTVTKGLLGLIAGALLAGGLGLIAFVVFLATFDPLGHKVELHTRDAAAFHQADSSRFVKLPAEAELVEVKKTSVWVDNTYEIRFRLPNTQAPDRWVRRIWAANRFAPGARQGPAHYRRYHESTLHHGHRSLKYLMDGGLYEAEVGTD